jgi:hypothetical protein
MIPVLFSVSKAREIIEGLLLKESPKKSTFVISVQPRGVRIWGRTKGAAIPIEKARKVCKSSIECCRETSLTSSHFFCVVSKALTIAKVGRFGVKTIVGNEINSGRCARRY